MLLDEIYDKHSEADTDPGGRLVAPEMQADCGAGFRRLDIQYFMAAAWEDDHSAHQDSDGDSELRRIQEILGYRTPNASPTASPMLQDSGPPSGPFDDGLGGFQLPPSIVDESTSHSTGESRATAVSTHAPQRGAYKAVRRTVAARTFKSSCEVTVTASGVVQKPHFMSSNAPIDDKVVRYSADVAQRRKADAERLKVLKTINSQTRTMLQQCSTHSSIPKPLLSNRGVRWGQLRINQIEHLSVLFVKGSDGSHLIGGYGFLNRDMRNTLSKLAESAVNGVLRMPNNHTLATASAPFWTLALAQESWRRGKGDDKWCAEDPDAAESIRWENLEDVYRHFLRGMRTKCMDINPKTGEEQLTARRVVSHGLGQSHKKVKDKMKCLHEMLLSGGDTLGLHWQIQQQMKPDVMRYGTQNGIKSAQGLAKDRALSGWKRKATREKYDGEDDDCARLAAVCGRMDDTD